MSLQHLRKTYTFSHTHASSSIHPMRFSHSVLIFLFSTCRLYSMRKMIEWIRNRIEYIKKKNKDFSPALAASSDKICQLFHLSDKFQIMLCVRIDDQLNFDSNTISSFIKERKGAVKKNKFIGSIIKHTHERVAFVYGMEKK